MATPHVTGVAALIKSKDSNLDDVGVNTELLQSVDVDTKSSLSTKVASRGRLNAARSLGIEPPDVTPPTVTATGPASNATGVKRNTNVTATFSEKMDPASISTSTFKLYKCSSTASTTCTTEVTDVAVTLSTDGLKATLDPYGTSSLLTLLGSRTKYKAVVTTEAKDDEAGNALDQSPSTTCDQQKEWYFTTGRS